MVNTFYGHACISNELAVFTLIQTDTIKIFVEAKTVTFKHQFFSQCLLKEVDVGREMRYRYVFTLYRESLVKSDKEIKIRQANNCIKNHDNTGLYIHTHHPIRSWFQRQDVIFKTLLSILAFGTPFTNRGKINQHVITHPCLYVFS